MELRQFISDALTQLMDGVIDAQENVKEKGGLIAPGRETIILFSGDNSGEQFYRERQVVEFDVVITVSESAEGKAGVGVFGGGISIGAQAKGETSNQTLSHLKFSVPIYLPQQKQGK